MLARMDRWAVLLCAPLEADLDVWNRRVLDLGCDLAGAVGVDELTLHLRDEPARELPLAPELGAPSFQALVELEGDERAHSALEAFGDLGAAHLYRVECRRLKAYPRTWPDGARTPGVEMLACVRRAAALSPDAFDAHWRERHGPLALRHHAGVWEYRQQRVLATVSPHSPDFDGIAVLGFPSADAYRERLYDSPEGRAAIADDLARFVDLPRSESTFTGEYVLRSG
jgi:uncharacterized protein (TIGR02118 family)